MALAIVRRNANGEELSRLGHIVSVLVRGDSLPNLTVVPQFDLLRKSDCGPLAAAQTPSRGGAIFVHFTMGEDVE